MASNVQNGGPDAAAPNAGTEPSGLASGGNGLVRQQPERRALRVAMLFCGPGEKGATGLRFANATVVAPDALAEGPQGGARISLLTAPQGWAALPELAEKSRLDAVILAHEGPSDTLARLLAADEPCEAALTAFSEEAARMLDFAERARACAILDLSLAAAAPQAAREALETRFGLILREGCDFIVDRPDAMFRLLAQRLIARAPKARALADRLAAAALVSGGEDETQLIAAALEAARALKSAEEQAALLKSHLAVVQSQVEMTFRRAVHAAGGDDAPDIRTAALRAELSAARAEVEALRGSLSWRLAAPLRAAMAILPRGAWRRGFRLRRRIALLNNSPFFDAEWYAGRYPDVAGDGLEPAEHYLRFGWREGRRPGPDFDPGDYLRANPDVAALGVDPLLHYLQHGRQEGRLLAPLRREEGAP